MFEFIKFLVLSLSYVFAYCRESEVNMDFERLYYDPIKRCEKYESGHNRSSKNCWSLNFKAFGKIFRLHSTKRGFINGRVINNKNEFDRNMETNGVSDLLLKVNGWVSKNGYFYGILSSTEETYRIEPVKKIFIPSNFHSTIYVIQNENLKESYDLMKRNGIRSKRFSHTRKKIDKKICRVSLEADYTFLKMAGSIFHSVSLMKQHIQWVNEIFQESFASGDKQKSRKLPSLTHNKSAYIQFQVANIRVYNELDSHRILGPRELDAPTFVHLMKERRVYSKYCLALFFTARSFIDGVLSLSKLGGVCTDWNVGVVTFVREGSVMSSYITKMAVANVIGQAFGAKVLYVS